ncbi:MAG TPA: PKD domain-containing protein, partial [Bacteroidetes bacterium]|nr:PKD domain-containing protein [Bacteroidota bacterium]
TIDPNGCPTDGVNRIVNPALAYHDRNVAQAQMKALSQWDPYRYLNIWVPRTIETNSTNGAVIGYATFPFNLATQPNLDGVVIHSGFFGREGDPQYLGRTTTHEVGHWMGLFHTFQGGCAGASSASCTLFGDHVCDTPQAANPNFNCPSGVNSCTDTPIDHPDQIDNYMDYADGICQSRYTQGQKDRMDYHVINYRSILISANNLTVTGCDGSAAPGCSPTADFLASNISSCPNYAVQFTDDSQGPATSWNWTFQNGTPSTSTDQNPLITYANPGTFDVTLSVTNSHGTANVTKSSFITISAPSAPPFSEDFESLTTLPIGWTFYDGDGATQWELVTGVGNNSNKCVKINNFKADNAGSNDNLITNSYDLSFAIAAELTFDRCYKRYNGFQVDTLRIGVSTDCGESWTIVDERSGVNVTTVGGFSSGLEYIPNASSAWVTDTIDLNTFIGNNAVKFRFQVTSGNGQSMYLDNVNLTFISVGAAEASQLDWSMAVSPNPFSNSLSVNYDLAKASKLKITLLDITGKVIWEQAKTRQIPGKYQEKLPEGLISNLPNGLYFLKGESQLGSITHKLIKQD